LPCSREICGAALLETLVASAEIKRSVHELNEILGIERF